MLNAQAMLMLQLMDGWVQTVQSRGMRASFIIEILRKILICGSFR